MTQQQEKHDLSRFVSAQAGDYETALAEIKSGRKKSHWMWYIFPQIDGLGFSPTARHYAVRDLDEARAYLAHPILGPRLVTICEALLALPDRDAEPIFGWPDVLKLRSSMTLFAAARPEEPVFRQVLAKFYGGEPDRRTLEILGLAG